MALLGYASTAATAATAAGSYAFSAASSYVFRPDASTSHTAPPAPTLKGRTTDDFSTVPPSSPSSTSSASTNPHRLSLRRANSSTPRVRLPSSAQRPSRPPSKSPSRSASLGSSPPPTTPSASPSTSPPLEPVRGEAENLVDRLNLEEDLYLILGVGKKAKSEEIRRAFLARSRVIHPDKLPLYPPSTTAFQRLSYAYETLSKPSSRRLYDLGGGRGYDPGSPSTNGPHDLGDETLNGVLRSVINEFLNGDFEMIRVFVTALNEGNPGLNLGDDAVDNLEGAFKRVREALLAGQRYLRLIKFELIRLYEIQHSLRTLSYFDVYGRLRLTLALTRVTLEIPMVLDRAMRDETPAPAVGGGPPVKVEVGVRERAEEGEDEGEGDGGKAGQLERRGLLGMRTRGMLVVTCKLLEKAERWAGS
ncbi:hypothetical protein JCM11641_003228 [Rhodosporidiobolus odoratus]